MTDRYRCRFETIQQRSAPTRQMESARTAFVRSRVRYASSQIPPTPPSVLRQVFVGYEARLKVTEPAHRKRNALHPTHDPSHPECLRAKASRRPHRLRDRGEPGREDPVQDSKRTRLVDIDFAMPITPIGSISPVRIQTRHIGHVGYRGQRTNSFPKKRPHRTVGRRDNDSIASIRTRDDSDDRLTARLRESGAPRSRARAALRTSMRAATVGSDKRTTRCARGRPNHC